MSGARVFRERDAVIAAQEAADALKVYRVRLRDDDGWFLFCARSTYQAKKLASAMTHVEEGAHVSRATPSQIENVAIRALEGL